MQENLKKASLRKFSPPETFRTQRVYTLRNVLNTPLQVDDNPIDAN